MIIIFMEEKFAVCGTTILGKKMRSVSGAANRGQRFREGPLGDLTIGESKEGRSEVLLGWDVFARRL